MANGSVPKSARECGDRATKAEETSFDRAVKFFSDVEPIVSAVGAGATIVLTIVLGVTSYYQGQRQERLFERQIQIEDAAADPAFTYISPQMLGRSTADSFALHKPTGSVLDLQLNPYDCVVLRVSANDASGFERPTADFELRVRGRFDTSVSFADGVYIVVDASQDFEPIDMDLTLLTMYLEDKGLQVEFMATPQSLSVLEMQYTKQTGEVAYEIFVLDAMTGQQINRYSSIDEESPQTLFASDFVYLDADWDIESDGSPIEDSIDKQNSYDVGQYIYYMMRDGRPLDTSDKSR